MTAAKRLERVAHILNRADQISRIQARLAEQVDGLLHDVRREFRDAQIELAEEGANHMDPHPEMRLVK